MISFKRLLELQNDFKNASEYENNIINSFHTVYIIINLNLNKVYIGETDNTFMRLYTFWKKDKRHVTGENAPINKIFNSDYENTFFDILEKDCDNQFREYYWHDYYRINYSYIIISHPGRHGCNNSGNTGLIAIHKENSQTYINKKDLDKFIKDGWLVGGKKQKPRTADQRKRISDSHLNQIPWNKGIKLTEKQKERYKGIKKSTNRTYTEEDKRLLRDKNIGRIKINKNGIEKQIQKEELDKYLNDGWKKGTAPKLALYKNSNGDEIIYNKSSANRNHKDWTFIRDIQ